MKKTSIILAVAATVLAAGCSKEAVQNTTPGRIKVTFDAQNAKSAIAADGKTIEWKANDYMAIYDGTTNNKFTYSTSNGTFTGTVKEGATKLYAVYPDLRDSRGDSPSKFDGNVLKTYLASCQNTVAGTFAPYANISACEPVLNGDKLSGTMQNLCAYLKFTITTDKIKKVLFTSVDNKKLSGLVYITFDEEGITMEGKENPYVMARNLTANSTAIGKGTYYVTIIPGNFVNGFKITMTDVDGNEYEYVTPIGIELAPGQTGNCGVIDDDLDAKKTGNLSLFYDFVAHNVSNLPSAKDIVANITLNVSESVKYTTSARGLYGNAGTAHYATMNGGTNKDAYLQTPAIEGKILKRALLSWRGHASNHQAQVSVWSEDYGSRLTGSYTLKVTPKFTGNESNFAAPSCYANPVYFTHLFHLGKEWIPGEQSVKPEQPEANTSYRVRSNLNGAGLLVGIELIYEPAVEE